MYGVFWNPEDEQIPKPSVGNKFDRFEAANRETRCTFPYDFYCINIFCLKFKKRDLQL